MSRAQDILEAAAELFYEKGFHGVGMDEIGERVGISGPGLYRHFKGKDEILATLLNEAMDELIAAAVVDDEHPNQALDRLVRHHVTFALGHRHLVNVYQREYRSLVGPWRRSFERRMRTYAARWEALLALCYPSAPREHVVCAVQASVGLIDSVAYWPGSALKAPGLADFLCRLVTGGWSTLERAARYGGSGPPDRRVEGAFDARAPQFAEPARAGGGARLPDATPDSPARTVRRAPRVPQVRRHGGRPGSPRP